MKNQKLWTKDFITVTVANFLIYIVFYLLMVLIADYAVDTFHASTGMAGLVSGIFIIGILAGRLGTGHIAENIGSGTGVSKSVANLQGSNDMGMQIENLEGEETCSNCNNRATMQVVLSKVSFPLFTLNRISFPLCDDCAWMLKALIERQVIERTASVASRAEKIASRIANHSLFSGIRVNKEQ